MPGKTPWFNFLFGKVMLTIATMVLAVASLVGGMTRPWPLIIGSAAFIVLHTAVNAGRDRNIVRRLGREYDRVQRRAIQVVSDLGQIAGNQFDLWMVDLYLCESSWSLSSHRPFIRRQQILSRRLSVSLIDARPQAPILDLFSGLHGQSFRESKPLLWFDETAHGSSPDNSWSNFATATNSEMMKFYGVLNVSPIVDQLGNDCIGILAVHVKPENDIALKALGALRSDQGQLRINNACVDLHGLLAR